MQHQNPKAKPTNLIMPNQMFPKVHPKITSDLILMAKPFLSRSILYHQQMVATIQLYLVLPYVA